MTNPTIDDDAPASSLPTDVQAQAQAEADRYYGAGPIAPWQPGATRAAAVRWPWLAGGGVLLLVAIAVFAALLDGDPAAVQAVEKQSPAISSFTSGSPLGDPDDDIVDEPISVPPAPPAAAATPEGGEQLAITRRGREWRIEASGAARLLVAQRLAGASGSSLRGDLASLSAARPLDLNWRGRSTAEAWRAVLGPGLSFVTQCDGTRCLVWLFQEGEPDAGLPVTARPVIPMPPVAEPVLVVAVPVKPSDSPDPRVAAHHD